MNNDPCNSSTLPVCPDPCDDPCSKRPCAGHTDHDPCKKPCSRPHPSPDPCDDPCDDTDDNGSNNGGDTVNPDIYPGTPLRWGSNGTDVANMQNRLNRLATVYTAINTQSVDGRFGQNMYNATIRFQRQHGLAADGVIGPQTWNRIVAVDNTQTGGGFTNVTTAYPGYVISRGASGDNVRFIQSYLSAIPGLFAVSIDGIFGANTEYLVRTFQTRYRLTVDGRVGPNTWAAMIQAFNASN